ncbi:epoxide hydrolase [Dactylosporangium vinaceum]|uniref:Epoxide hydrolase family protein n=1 Tax=Dactylosporangium vinaceum TaxID=53362 RepID=A0ABV5M6I0_9ACTN|nr:epoxide hydrolase family protein [Dactylosporangium vinaceum]UAB97875.1 epoxide hydrolase [Dactylosporangium vinaceum]
MTPFQCAVPDEALADLRRRIRATRWPGPAPVPGWAQGVPEGYLRDLCAYWADGYDWRRFEARLNGFAQFRTSIDGLGVHLVHAPSPHPRALPIVVTHGWPGSIVEFLGVVAALTHPDDPDDAFHVVLPSLPGYGFSDAPAEPGWDVERIARAWAELMDRLGYARYGAMGSDWGTSVTTAMGLHDTGHLAGIHVCPPIAAPVLDDDLTAPERAALADLEAAQRDGDGYSLVQSTRPQTIGYALNDSPVGLCAWIAEKFVAWSEDPARIDRDALLDNVTLYWLTGTATSSARLYWESFRQVQAWFTTSTADTVPVPTACTVFPRDLPRPSQRWARRRYPRIVHWGEPAHGGHFAALERPELWVAEVRAAFRTLR